MHFQLSENSKPRVVPSSRIGRMISFGSLAAGLGVGTVAQYARNTLQSVTGRADNDSLSSTFLSTANAERIVDTLCKVRGWFFKLSNFLPHFLMMLNKNGDHVVLVNHASPRE